MRLQCVSFQISIDFIDFHEIYGMSVMPLQATTICGNNTEKARTCGVKATLAPLKIYNLCVVIDLRKTRSFC
jgi:hypothetical protein